MLKVQGFDKLQRQLKEAQKALQDFDGQLGEVKFDPENPGSIQQAIVAMEQMVDERLGAYASNPLIGPMAEQAKEMYREAILDKAAAARLEGDAS